MPDDDVLPSVEAFLHAEHDKPFGAIRIASNRLRQPFSQASAEAARNLLVKAQRSRAHGVGAHAARLLERAAALPFDIHEGVQPALWEAHLMLFSRVVDALEASDFGDPRWLEVALETVQALKGVGRASLVDTLRTIVAEYEVSPGEVQLATKALAAEPLSPSPQDLRLAQDELIDALTSLLDALTAYETALYGP